MKAALLLICPMKTINAPEEAGVAEEDTIDTVKINRKVSIMKIAVCTQEKNEKSLVDSRFGRAGSFAIFDDESKQWSFIENAQNLQAAQGAGIQAAQFIIDADAEVLLARNVGPKAMAALGANSIKVFNITDELTAEQAVAAFADNKLQALDQANVEGHWS